MWQNALTFVGIITLAGIGILFLAVIVAIAYR